MSEATATGKTSDVSLLQDLGQRIAADAATVCNYLQENQLPLPSFRPDDLPTVLPLSSPSGVQEARQRLISASLEMLHLASGPSDFLPQLTTNVNRTDTT